MDKLKRELRRVPRLYLKRYIRAYEEGHLPSRDLFFPCARSVMVGDDPAQPTAQKWNEDRGRTDHVIVKTGYVYDPDADAMDNIESLYEGGGDEGKAVRAHVFYAACREVLAERRIIPSIAHKLREVLHA